MCLDQRLFSTQYCSGTKSCASVYFLGHEGQNKSGVHLISVSYLAHLANNPATSALRNSDWWNTLKFHCEHVQALGKRELKLQVFLCRSEALLQVGMNACNSIKSWGWVWTVNHPTIPHLIRLLCLIQWEMHRCRLMQTQIKWINKTLVIKEKKNIRLLSRKPNAKHL